MSQKLTWPSKRQQNQVEGSKPACGCSTFDAGTKGSALHGDGEHFSLSVEMRRLKGYEDRTGHRMVQNEMAFGTCPSQRGI